MSSSSTQKKSKETSENSDFWFICPKCQNSIPLLSHFYSEEKQKWQIEIQCSCQKNSSYSMDISEFLKLKSTKSFARKGFGMTELYWEWIGK